MGIAAPLLTHADPRTTERYYNMARALDAGRAHAQIVDTLRQRRGQRSVRKQGKGHTCAP